MYKIVILISIFLMGCATPRSASYRALYAHLDIPLNASGQISQSDYFLVLLVDARHLDYTNDRSFLKTLAKHPSDGSKNGDVGHAWIYLQGMQNGECVYLEGGHSGELGVHQAKYFEGIMNYIDYGYANPTGAECMRWRHEPNPAKYLWETLNDGFFQWGAGRHRPTFAAKINLTQEQFHRILRYVECYPYQQYSLVGNQCSSFLAQAAALGGLDLECEVTLPIDPYVVVDGMKIQLWCDPCYSQLTISSPDILEKSLRQAVRDGRAEYALDWYYGRFGRKIEGNKHSFLESISKLPFRCARIKSL